jgi:Carboxypeptidase regulatory-like domain
MKKKRKPRKRIGTSLTLLLAVLLAAFLPLAAAPKKKPALDVYAVVSGTVFDDRGYALAGADVILAPEAQPTKANTVEMLSDARGEFVIRVPPGPMHYNATVQAKGYQSQRKNVTVEGQERVEVTFQLERESK